MVNCHPTNERLIGGHKQLTIFRLTILPWIEVTLPHFVFFCCFTGIVCLETGWNNQEHYGNNGLLFAARQPNVYDIPWYVYWVGGMDLLALALLAALHYSKAARRYEQCGPKDAMS